MPSVKHIVIVAGEESGDDHAAALVRDLKKTHPNWEFSGIGGYHLQAAGVHLLSDLARFGVTGLTEVIRQFKTIKQAFRKIQAHLKEIRPDLLILVDYPGFNLRLAKFAKQQLGIKVLYYISPQIWAWKAGRMKTIKASVDHMAVIFPFEKYLYEKTQVPVSFVGHPLVDKVRPCQNQDALRKQLGLPIDQRILALLPGSRVNEVERHMPILVQTAEILKQRFPDIHIVIPVAINLQILQISQYFKHSSLAPTLIQGHAIQIASCADFNIVASGTASLECALVERPLCIIYKVSLFTSLVAAAVIRVKYLALCNVLQNKMIVPELLQYDFNSQNLTELVSDYFENPLKVEKMHTRLNQLKSSLASNSAKISLTSLVERMVEL